MSTINTQAPRSRSAPGDYRTRRRRAVARALARYMDREKLLDAVRTWMAKYDAAEDPDVFAFVSECTDKFDDPGLEVDAIMRVHKQLQNLEKTRAESQSPGAAPFNHELSSRLASDFSRQKNRPASQPTTSVPTAMPARRTPRQKPATPSVAPQFVVFNHFLDITIERIAIRKPDAPPLMCRYLKRVFASAIDLSDAESLQINRWLDSTGRYKITAALDAERLAEFLHEIYIWACEEIGPVETDKIFGAATREAEQLPQAAQFSPRTLL